MKRRIIGLILSFCITSSLIIPVGAINSTDSVEKKLTLLT